MSRKVIGWIAAIICVIGAVMAGVAVIQGRDGMVILICISAASSAFITALNNLSS